MKTKHLVLLLTCVSLSVFALAIYQQLQANRAQGIGRFAQDRETYAKLGGDALLESTSGEVSLAQLRQNKLVLLFFGFTRCPHICSSSLATIQAGLSQLSPPLRKKIQVVFVTVDPHYDTPERLQSYVSSFVPDGLGLRTGQEQTKALARAYAAAYNQAVPDADTSDDYTMEHSTKWYVIDRKGIGTVFDYNQPTEQIADILGTFAAQYL